MKSYLRFEPTRTFSVIASPQCNVCYDFSGNLAITGGLQDLCVWNIKQGSKVADIREPSLNYPYSSEGEVTIVSRCFDKSNVAVGYSNGEVRVINYMNKTVAATLRGHRPGGGGVSCIGFMNTAADSVQDISGSSAGRRTLMATGGKDCDIFIWDLVTYTAVARLRGHKDMVTSVEGFHTRSTVGMRVPSQYLVSVSKDSLMKVWDMTTFCCVQTIVGHRTEIWSMTVSAPLEGGGADDEEEWNKTVDEDLRIFTGSADDQIRGYRLSQNVSADESDDALVLEYYGSISRTAGGSQSNSLEKCVSLEFNSSGNILAAQSTGKVVQLFRLREKSESKKKLKRRLRRLREKLEKQERGEPDASSKSKKIKTSNLLSVWAEEETEEADNCESELTSDLNSNNPNAIVLDELEHYSYIHTTHKIRGFAFSPAVSKRSVNPLVAHVDHGMVALINNVLEIYDVPVVASLETTVSAETAKPTKVSVVDGQGHRSDVRCVALSSNGEYIASCSTDGVKFWSTKTLVCIRSCKLSTSASGYAVTVAYLPGDAFVIVGTRDGSLQVVDTSSGESVVHVPDAHEGAVWSLCVRPDGNGVMTGSADKEVKFWDFSVNPASEQSEGKNGPQLALTLSRQLKMTHDVLCVKYSPTKSQDKLLIAIGVMDSTIKVFYDDSLKFFLSLYGHKLPVMCLDISYDSKILVSGSADKTIKIWGLDFGDCHRSLIAHEDSVTSVRFQPSTHYLFSTGKDGQLKYWDTDKFEQILKLPGHNGPVWGVDVGAVGGYGNDDAGMMVVTCGQDRSLRIWERGEDLVFIEEERERALEHMVNDSTERQLQQGSGALGSTSTVHVDGNEDDEDANKPASNDQSLATTLSTIESVKGGERIMEALDLVESELQAQKENSNAPPNPILLGMNPYKYMLFKLRSIKAPDLEQALLVLPFHFVVRFVPLLIELCRQSLDIELCTRCTVFLFRSHQSQLVVTHSLRHEITELQNIIRQTVGNYRTLIGGNMEGLRYMQHKLQKNDDLFL